MGVKQGVTLSILIALCLLLAPYNSRNSAAARPASDAPPGCWRGGAGSRPNGAGLRITRFYTANGDLWAISNRNYVPSAHGQPLGLHWNNSGWDPLPALPITQTYGIASAKIFSASDV